MCKWSLISQGNFEKLHKGYVISEFSHSKTQGAGILKHSFSLKGFFGPRRKGVTSQYSPPARHMSRASFWKKSLDIDKQALAAPSLLGTLSLKARGMWVRHWQQLLHPPWSNPIPLIYPLMNLVIISPDYISHSITLPSCTATPESKHHCLSSALLK